MYLKKSARHCHSVQAYVHVHEKFLTVIFSDVVKHTVMFQNIPQLNLSTDPRAFLGAIIPNILYLVHTAHHLPLSIDMTVESFLRQRGQMKKHCLGLKEKS